MKILSVGPMNGLSNTCLHRHWALTRISDKIDSIDLSSKRVSFYYKVCNRLFNWGIPIYLPDTIEANKTLLSKVTLTKYDILWIDKGVTINRKTLVKIKKRQPNLKIINFSPDNMVERHNQSQNYLESINLYDFHVTTKSFILDRLKELGAKNIIFSNKSYEDKFHYPRNLTKSDTIEYGGGIGFVGAWEKQRSESIKYLVNNGLKVTVFGGGKWNKYVNYSENLTIRKPLYREDYPKVLQAFKISLCFLRKINSDQQTARTMEIPACGGFLLAERTNEHLRLFEEGKEADFFSSNEELLEKCEYYLQHETLLADIAKAGRSRCVTSGYSNLETIGKIIRIISNEITDSNPIL